MANDVYDFVENTGTIVPNTEVIQTQVENEFLNAFGQDLNTSPNTPQGVLITTEVLARTAVADNNVAVANQINPNLAGGVFLDAILALTGAQRNPATYTIVVAGLTGQAGIVVPMGSLAQSEDTGIQYALQAPVTIPGNGTFVATTPGPNPVAIGDLNIIVSPVVGWETVSNIAAQTSLGSFQQSDVQARTQRIQTLALQGTAMSEAIISALIALAPNTSLFYQENVTSGTIVLKGVTMVSHSIYICIASTATLLQIATTILAKKSGGCGYNNGPGINQSVAVTDPYSGQVYTVLFDTPRSVSISINVYITANPPVPNYITAIQTAILNYATGAITGQPGFGVGQAVSPFEIASAITQAYPQIFVRDLEIAITGNLFAPALIPIAVYQQAMTTSGNISVFAV